MADRFHVWPAPRLIPWRQLWGILSAIAIDGYIVMRVAKVKFTVTDPGAGREQERGIPCGQDIDVTTGIV